MTDQDANLEWDLALAAAESDEDEYNIGGVAKNMNAMQMPVQKSKSTKIESKQNTNFNAKIAQSQAQSSFQEFEEDNGDDNGWGDDDGNDGWGGDNDEDGDSLMDGQQINSLTKKDKKMSMYSKQSSTIMVYSQDEIQEQMPMKVHRANEILCLENDDHVISVCRYFNWNQLKLQETWFEQQEELALKIGIQFDPKIRNKYPEVDDSLASKNDKTCPICYLEFDNSDESTKADQLVCGHQFNKMCWEMMLKNKVKSGTDCIFAKCPQVRCNVVVPHSFFMKYLKDKADPEDGINYLKKYQTWHCKQMTDQNKNMKWCPQKACNYIIEKPDFVEGQVAECRCGHTFCFYCEHEDHLPSTCDQVKIWKEKESSDSENITWLKANCKPCPKCSSLIEKNQGCMHITCQKCHHGFCWLCLTEWGKHSSNTGGYYACNIYEDLKKSNQQFKSQEQIAQDSKNEILKYQFHYERYNNHQKSKEICKKQKNKNQDNMKLLNQVKKYPAAELLFFDQCADQIIRCRQVLKWTYVVSFYAGRTMKAEKNELFKFQQTSLEEACERTHQLMEQDLSVFLDMNQVDRTPFFKFRADLINQMNVLQSSYESFVSVIINDEAFQ